MSKQTEYWAGENGDKYHKKHQNSAALGTMEANCLLFERTLAPLLPDERENLDVLELGANRAQNAFALREALPGHRYYGVEINKAAADEAEKAGGSVKAILRKDVTDYQGIKLRLFKEHGGSQFDLVLTKGLLIHIKPDMLRSVYRTIYEQSRRWILLCEYYAPRIEEIPYKGRPNLLWRGPHAEHMMDTYPRLMLKDYGFVSRLAGPAAQDDITWWLLEKPQ